MAVSAYPALVDALVAQLPAGVPAGVVVTDGMVGLNVPYDSLQIGIPSLSESGPIYTGSSRSVWATVGPLAKQDEEGELRCVAAASSQNETAKDARDRVQAIVEAVQTLCRATPSLGLSQVLWTVVGTEKSWGLSYDAKKPLAVFCEFVVMWKARL